MPTPGASTSAPGLLSAHNWPWWVAPTLALFSLLQLGPVTMTGNGVFEGAPVQFYAWLQLGPVTMTGNGGIAFCTWQKWQSFNWARSR